VARIALPLFGIYGIANRSSDAQPRTEVQQFFDLLFEIHLHRVVIENELQLSVFYTPHQETSQWFALLTSDSLRSNTFHLRMIASVTLGRKPNHLTTVRGSIDCNAKGMAILFASIQSSMLA
jgi:hypothetical protein